MTEFGIYDHAQKAWLHICATLDEANEKLLHADVKTAVVVLYTGTPEAPAEAAPAAPQEEVAVVTGNEPDALFVEPAPVAPAEPEVAA